MQPRPTIAVVTPSILTGIGMKAILEKVIPIADVEVFGDFTTFAESEPEQFYHCFIAASLYTDHAPFFRERRHKIILLCNGQPREGYAGMHCLDVCTSEEGLVHDILSMHHGAHRHDHDMENIAPKKGILTDREVQVLILVARGYINKQIADRLSIGLTTVISHRRNISEKLGLRSVAELAIYAVRCGYIDAETI